jgi:hypothetical protein
LVLAYDGYVASLRTFGSLLNVEFNLLTFFQALETISLECGIMDKDIRSALAGDETETFACIKPFDCAGDTF